MKSLEITGNTHVETLEPIFERSEKQIDWLVIAHRDTEMLQRLSAGLQDESAAILELPLDTDAVTNEALHEVIEWALVRGGIKNLLLAWSSNAVAGETHPLLPESTSSDYSKLLSGVQQLRKRNQAATERFASLVQEIAQLPAVRSYQADEPLDVHGLFYRSDDGVFMSYDQEANTFSPLVA